LDILRRKQWASYLGEWGKNQELRIQIPFVRKWNKYSPFDNIWKSQKCRIADSACCLEQQPFGIAFAFHSKRISLSAFFRKRLKAT
jgi:hypothetical protein